MKNIMHATRLSLPEKDRIEIVEILNKTLASVLDLYAQLKQAHWNVKGTGFISLHLLFDTIAEEVEEQADIVAERIMALGGTALGTIQEIANNSALRTYPTNIFTVADHIEHLTHNIAILGERTRENIDQTDELDDKATNDIYIGLARMLDKNLWFIEAHVQK
jgi:starvation-inducible DNA-binding protein